MSEVKHTQFAARAIGLAELFKLLAAKPIAGPVAYQAELSAPDGPSTGGGKQAVQHIKLIPNDQSPTLVAGSANGPEKAAELRTFAFIKQQHAARFKGAKLGLSKESYDAFFGQLQNFFTSQGMKVSITDVSVEEQAALQAQAGGSKKTLMIAGAVAAVVAIGAGLLVALR